MGKKIKNYTDFINEEAEPAVKPVVAPPKIKPAVKPHNPIRKDQPAVIPRPKAKKATSEDVANKFIQELKNMGSEPVKGLDYEALKKRWSNKDEKKK